MYKSNGVSPKEHDDDECMIPIENILDDQNGV